MVASSWGTRLRVFVRNSLKRGEKQLLMPQTSADGTEFLTWYSCGPTVYDVAHLGHARTYVSFDIVKRALRRVFGVRVLDVMGVTDIDAKILKRAEELEREPSSIARECEASFWKDMKRLNIEEPVGVARVSEHIPDIDRFVRELLEGGFAYESTDGSVYFDVESLRGSYGRLRAVRVEEGNEANPAEGVGKRRPEDFALWKATEGNGWDTSFSRGIPGWHIECSAMIEAIFGEKIDVHVGGIDLAFPHHENEIAQSTALLRCRHGRDCSHGRKMSKSLKNFITVPEIFSVAAKEGFEGVRSSSDRETADAFRWLCASSHYRNRFEFTPEKMAEAIERVKGVQRALKEVETLSEKWRRDEVLLRETAAASVGSSLEGSGAFYPSTLRRASLTAADLQLWHTFERSEERFARALSDDFDTKYALNAVRDSLFELQKTASQRASSADPLSSRVLDKGIESVRDMLGSIGFSFESAAAERRGDETAGEGTSLQSVAEAIVEVRERLRGIAVGGSGEEAESRQSLKEMKREIFRLTDHIRDAVLPSFGWTVRDGVGLVPFSREELRQKSESKKEQRDRKEEGEEGGEASKGKSDRRRAVTPQDRAEVWLQQEYGYTAFDAVGLPTHGPGEEPLSKNALKKARKRWEQFRKLQERAG